MLIFSCEAEKQKQESLFKFIPSDAAVVLKFDNIQAFSSNLNNNEFIANNAQSTLIKDLKSRLKNLKHLDTDQSIVMGFTRLDKNHVDFTIATPYFNGLFASDSTLVKTVETTSYSKNSFDTYIIDNTTSYTTILDSVFIASSSQLIIENTIRDFESDALESQPQKDKSLTQMDSSIYLNTEGFNQLLNDYLTNLNTLPVQNLTDEVELALTIEQKVLQFDGIATSKDSIPKVLDIFKSILPQTSSISLVTPLTSKGFYSFTYDDFSMLRENLKNYHAKNKELLPIDDEPFYSSGKEVGVIFLNDSKVTFLNSIDPTITQDALASYTESHSSFRDVQIFKYNQGNSFAEALNPLILAEGLKFHAQLDSYFLFAETTEALETCIANYQNKTVLGLQDFYTETARSLSDESSLLMVLNTQDFQDALEKDAYLKDLKFKDFRLAALQFVHERDFTHVHGIIEKAGAKAFSKAISQKASVGLDNPIMMKPQFFSNHTNGSQDIVVQDEENNLYLISNSGKILWKKQLDGPILGQVQEVDLYKNGKFQLAFNTANSCVVIDRNGNLVDGYPIKFKSTVTQPLSVFDYDNNKNYRFLITQDDNVTMYNKEGKTVSGFKFSKADARITQAPKHIRIGSKDYILIMTKSGKLHILSRTGSDRVTINANLDTSENDWYKYENAFASTNENGELMKISQSGKLSFEKLDLPQDHNIVATNKTLVTLEGNNLTIKGKTIELDFGIYSQPNIFYINNKIYVSVTDSQAHKVYLFDSNGILRPNFPVYGNSAMDLRILDKQGTLGFVTQGEDDSLLIYRIN